MVAGIGRDLETRPLENCLTVTLSDYIDRGPDSRDVPDRLAPNPFPTEFVALRRRIGTITTSGQPEPRCRSRSAMARKSCWPGRLRPGAICLSPGK